MRKLAAIALSSTAFITVPAMAQTGPQQTQQPPVRTESGQAQTGQGVTVQSVISQPLYRESGQEFGRVTRVVRADNGQIFLVVNANNRMVMMPAAQLTVQSGRHIVRGNDQQIGAFSEFREGMAQLQPVAANERIDVASMQTQGPDGARIVVQQPAPQIQVHQAPPQVAIQQAQPNVTVRQLPPEIVVRQGAPTVTVDIPQPEIIVRMPQPEVNVAVAQPQVEVRQPQPQVQVVQPQQPQVEVNRSQQAQVSVQPAQPQVTLQQDQAQPQIRYERAEPQVRVNQAQGQPNVRFEQLQPGQEQQAQIQAPATTGSIPPAAGATDARAFSTRELMDRNIYNLRGEQFGDVERVLIGQGNRGYVVIGHGGFLGLGEKKIMLPLEQIRVQGDRLVMPGLTDDQIRAMPEFNAGAVQGYREADAAYRVNIGLHR